MLDIVADHGTGQVDVFQGGQGFIDISRGLLQVQAHLGQFLVAGQVQAG